MHVLHNHRSSRDPSVVLFRVDLWIQAQRNLRQDETKVDAVLCRFASDLTNLVATCLPSLSLQDRSKVAALHFWRGIHQSETVRNLFGSRKVTDRSLEKAIALARDTAEPVAQGNAFMGAKGKGDGQYHYNHGNRFFTRPHQTFYKPGLWPHDADCASHNL